MLVRQASVGASKTDKPETQNAEGDDGARIFNTNGLVQEQ
jgi:hypothetical protein